MVVPMHTPVKLTAVSAENHLCKAVIAGEAALLACWADMNYPAADKLCLYLHEELLWNDRFVIAFDVVLRNGAVVLDPLLCQEVCGIGLLQERVTHVLLIAEDLVDGAGVPFCLASASKNSVSHKSIGNLIHAGAFEVFPVYALDGFSLFRVDDKVTVLILGISEETVVIDLHLSLLVAVLQPHLHILAE